MDNHENITLTEILLPENNKYVTQFSSYSEEKQLQILKLGLSTFTYSTDKFKTVMNGEKEDIIDKLTGKHTKEINDINNINSSLQSTIRKLEKENREQQKKFKNTLNDKIQDEKQSIKINLDRIYGEKILELENKINVLEQKKDELNNQNHVQQKEYYEQIIQEKKQSSEEINKVRLDYQEKIEEYRRQMEIFQKVNQNSTLKGQKGEDIMYNILVDLFPGCQIDTHTSKEGHKGDFSLIDDTHRGMIESKNYKKNVPKNEIQKFYNDIENNNEIDYAILCSLKSGVANKPKDFTLEFINGKPAIFLHKVKNSKKSVYLAYTVCKLILKNIDCFDITKEENQIKIKQIVKSYFQNHKKIVSMSNDYNKNINEMLEKQLNDFNTILNLINMTS